MEFKKLRCVFFIPPLDKCFNLCYNKFKYDNYGNCTKKQNYNTGAIFNYTWTRGRLLNSVNTTTYTYNKDGIRTRKVVVDGDNIITHEYFYDGSKLIAEKVGDDYFYFFYDESGVCGFRYKDMNYEYVKNIFGDIIGIYNEYGTHVATYVYDAWGNMTYCNAGTDVALINPFLYRGYYFDSESGLYYLMSRYYDPEIGQFISMDTVNYMEPDKIGGVDLYAYCGNNPVMYMDPTGHDANSFSSDAIDFLSLIIEGGIGFALYIYKWAIETAARPNNIGIGKFNKWQDDELKKIGKTIDGLKAFVDIIAVVSVAASVYEGIQTDIARDYTWDRVLINMVTNTMVYGSSTWLLGKVTPLIGNLIGAAVGSVVPVHGTAVGAVIGSVAGTAIGYAAGIGLGLFLEAEDCGKSRIDHIRDWVYDWIIGFFS